MLAQLFTFGFWLILLFNPWFRKFDYGGGWPLVILFAFAVGVLTFWWWRGKRRSLLWEHLVAVGLALWLGLSYVFSTTQNVGFSEVIAWSSCLLFYLVVAGRDRSFLERFLKLVAWSAGVAVVLGLIFFLFQDEPRMFAVFYNLEDHSHKWPNAFALFVLMCWPLVWMLKGRWRYLLLGLLLSGLALSYSRGAMIAFGGQLALWLLVLAWQRNLRLDWRAVLVTVLMVPLVFWGANSLRAMNQEVVDLGEKVSFANQEKVTSVDERADYIGGAVELMSQRPVFGWGPYSFRYAYNGIQQILLGSSDHPHNVFLKLGAESGAPAMLLFLALLLLVVVRTDLSKAMPAFVAMAGAVAHSLIDYNFNFLTNLWLFFVLLAYLSNFDKSEEVWTAGQRGIRATLAVLLICFALWEGGGMVLAKYDDASYYNYSLFPRNHYLTSSDRALAAGNFEESLAFADQHLSRNQLEAQAYYLKGKVHCNEEFTAGDKGLCLGNLHQAVVLNPYNDLDYYVDYIANSGSEADKEIVERAKELLGQYFVYVQNNVHFTGYTHNVEAAYELVEVLRPFLEAEEYVHFLEEREKMWKKALELRANIKKTF